MKGVNSTLGAEWGLAFNIRLRYRTETLCSRGQNVNNFLWMWSAERTNERDEKRTKNKRDSSGTPENSDSAYHVAWPKQKTRKGGDDSCDDSWDSSKGQHELALSLMENINAVSLSWHLLLLGGHLAQSAGSLFPSNSHSFLIQQIPTFLPTLCIYCCPW